MIDLMQSREGLNLELTQLKLHCEELRVKISELKSQKDPFYKMVIKLIMSNKLKISTLFIYAFLVFGHYEPNVPIYFNAAFILSVICGSILHMIMCSLIDDLNKRESGV